MTTDAAIALGVGMAFGVAAASAVVLIAHDVRAWREAKRERDAQDATAQPPRVFEPRTAYSRIAEGPARYATIAELTERRAPRDAA